MSEPADPVNKAFDIETDPPAMTPEEAAALPHVRAGAIAQHKLYERVRVAAEEALTKRLCAVVPASATVPISPELEAEISRVCQEAADVVRAPPAVALNIFLGNRRAGIVWCAPELKDMEAWAAGAVERLAAWAAQ